MLPLSKRTKKIITKLFSSNDVEIATRKITDECADNLPFCENENETSIERIRFAALKVSNGDIKKLTEAIDLAKKDWRDLLVAADFANDLETHNKWAVKIINTLMSPRVKVKVRFVGNLGKRCTPEQMLKSILPALWDEGDTKEVIATIGHFTGLFNENRIFFYPFPLDLNKTRLLDINAGGYQHFPWDMPDEDVHPLCKTCRDWDFGKTLAPVKPFLMQGPAHAFLCPDCHNIIIDDYAAGKAGMTYYVTKKQFKEKFGMDAPD